MRLLALIAVAAAIAALLGPRRLRWVFWSIAALALAYTLLRLMGVVEGPAPARVGVK